MDRRGGHVSGSSSSAWNTPLHAKPRVQTPDGRLPGPSKPAMAVERPALTFKPAVQQNPICSSSDDDSESGGEGGGRHVDVLESSIMADYPSTEDMDSTGASYSLF